MPTPSDQAAYEWLRRDLCIELGCRTPRATEDAYCLQHRAQFWPLWAAHPIDEACPPGCPSTAAEMADAGLDPSNPNDVREWEDQQ
jgi:hypothetical protein